MAFPDRRQGSKAIAELIVKDRVVRQDIDGCCGSSWASLPSSAVREDETQWNLPVTDPSSHSADVEEDQPAISVVSILFGFADAVSELREDVLKSVSGVQDLLPIFAERFR